MKIPLNPGDDNIEIIHIYTGGRPQHLMQEKPRIGTVTEITVSWWTIEYFMQ